ncbi:MAG: hypothetical protein EVB09_01365 [Verrucomicrobiaceae bacterium]|nr:MAG: hypothetical protein EVB09_01365 [Verrucomicrobiaceae bacterium]
MKERFLITIITALLFSAFDLILLAQDQNKSLNDVKDIKKVHQLNDGIKEKAKSINTDFLVFTKKLRGFKKVPLVIYLHGAGGRGNNIEAITRQVVPLWRGIVKNIEDPCIVVAPQCLREARGGGRGSWKYEELNEWLNQLKGTLPIDLNRIYLTGNSMGGYGSWLWGGNSPEHFAAIAPIVGGIGPGGPKAVTKDLDKWAKNLAKVPVYAFAGAKDKVVPAERSERMVSAIRKAGGKLAKIKVYSDEGHGAKRLVISSAEYYKWMFSQKRK